MKTKLILFTVIALLLGGMGCEKEEKIENFSYLKCAPELKIGVKDDIIGKWKLVETWTMIGIEDNAVVNDTIDVSCKNIFYEFKPDKTLTITGEGDDIPAGTYSYSYQPANVCPTCLPAPNLTISDFKPIFCPVYEYKLIFTLQGKMFLRIK
jgi:hypothetical protein